MQNEKCGVRIYPTLVIEGLSNFILRYILVKWLMYSKLHTKQFYFIKV